MRLSDAGGILDGVYYVPRSLLTQKRNREQAFKDIMQRYSLDPESCHLYSSSQKFVSVAKELGINATHLNEQQGLIKNLKALLKNSTN